MPNRPDDLVVSVEPRNDGGATPGPWVATLDGDWWMVMTEAAHSIGDEEYGPLPVVDLFHGGYDYSSFELGSIAGNAHLIAAAPDMRDALTKLRKALDLIDPARPLQYANTMDLMRKCADAALAKTMPEPPTPHPRETKP